MNNKNIPGGVNLVDPNMAGASATQKDYLNRKENLLKDVQMLEKKYNIRLGAEARYTPTGVVIVMVTYDMKGKKDAKKPLPN